jgi:hypothetical protein
MRHEGDHVQSECTASYYRYVSKFYQILSVVVLFQPAPT